MTYALYRVYSM